MAEAFWSTFPVWQQLLGYAFLLLSLLIFVKTSQLQVGGKKLIKLHWRIALALFFPAVFVLGLVFGVFLLGLGICVLALLALTGWFTGKKLRIRIVKPKRPVQ